MSGSVDGSVIVAAVVYEVPSVKITTQVRFAGSAGSTCWTCGVHDTERTERPK
jgi:hypothetical protein